MNLGINVKMIIDFFGFTRNNAQSTVEADTVAIESASIAIRVVLESEGQFLVAQDY